MGGNSVSWWRDVRICKADEFNERMSGLLGSLCLDRNLPIGIGACLGGGSDLAATLYSHQIASVAGLFLL